MPHSPLTMRTVWSTLLLLGLPLTLAAQEDVSAPLPVNSRFSRQIQDAKSGKASNFADKNFNTAVFNTKVLNPGKNTGLNGSANNFSFPNKSFAKQFQTGTFGGFGGSFNTPDNKTFATSQVVDPGRRPFSGQTLNFKADRDSEKNFSAQNWSKQYHDDGKLYQGREMTELGRYSGTVILQNKDSMKWEQESLSSAQIKEILNKNK